jgi:LuxR family maltose regulon positive regulatory protein
MKKGLYEDAVAHATNCGEHALAADALNMWATQLVAGAHLRTLEFWSERVPLGEIAQRPDLAIKCVYALVFLRRWQRARPLLDLIGALPDTGSVSTTTDPKVVLCMAAGCADEMPHGLGEGERTPLHPEDCNEFAPFELGAAANLRACCALSTHDFEKAREHLMIARVYNERIEAAFSRGYTSAVGGVALLIQGSLQEALAKFREGLAEQRGELDNSFALAALISCYVWALYEANELDTAEKLFRQHHDVIGESTLPDFLTVAYLSIARLHDARGRPVKSEAILDEAEAIGRDNGWSRLVSIVNWERVRRHIVRGAADQALRAAAPAQTGHRLPRSWIPFGNDVEDQELGEIRLALAQGSLDEVGQRIDEAFKRQRGRTLRQIKLHLLHAHQGVLQDDNGSARRALRAALRLARPGRFIRCILDEGPVALQLLHDEYQRALDNANGMRRGSEIEFLELLLKASGTDIGSDPAAVHAMLQPLTNREREMLVLLANGISNKDMASRLFVSENTVKFHLKSIYAKLSVTSRVQATTVARQIGILA